MDREEILRRLDHVRRNVAGAQSSVQILPHVTRLRGSGGDWHQIAFSALSPADADARIAAEVEHYRGAQLEVEWTVYGHDEPRDLLARLSRQGFSIGPRELVLVLDLQPAPEWVMAAPEARVERVKTAEGLAAYASVSERVFDAHHASVVAHLRQAINSGATGHLGYVAFDGAEPVSIGRLHTSPESPFGGLYGGGTLPGRRGRGYYRAIVAARARDAIELGARYLRVDALPTSQPILERLGFVRITESWPCVLAAPEI